MKTLFRFLVGFLLTNAAYAGGTVWLENKYTAAGVDAPFFDYQGIRLAGPSYVAQLYWGNEATSLSPVGDTVPFKVNGYFLWYTRELPIEDGYPAWVQVRAWAVAGGDSYEIAKDAGVWTGLSNVLYLPFTGNPSASPPTLPVHLTGLKFMGIPEPSTYALMLMGIGALACRNTAKR